MLINTDTKVYSLLFSAADTADDSSRFKTILILFGCSVFESAIEDNDSCLAGMRTLLVLVTKFQLQLLLLHFFMYLVPKLVACT